jgi:hypothetical protein
MRRRSKNSTTRRTSAHDLGADAVARQHQDLRFDARLSATAQARLDHAELPAGAKPGLSS